jgi:hypothetical protein
MRQARYNMSREVFLLRHQNFANFNYLKLTGYLSMITLEAYLHAEHTLIPDQKRLYYGAICTVIDARETVDALMSI